MEDVSETLTMEEFHKILVERSPQDPDTRKGKKNNIHQPSWLWNPVMFRLGMDIKYPVMFRVGMDIKYTVMFRVGMDIKYPVMFKLGMDIKYPVMFRLGIDIKYHNWRTLPNFFSYWWRHHFRWRHKEKLWKNAFLRKLVLKFIKQTFSLSTSTPL